MMAKQYKVLRGDSLSPTPPGMWHMQDIPMVLATDYDALHTKAMRLELERDQLSHDLSLARQLMKERDQLVLEMVLEINNRRKTLGDLVHQTQKDREQWSHDLSLAMRQHKKTENERDALKLENSHMVLSGKALPEGELAAWRKYTENLQNQLSHTEQERDELKGQLPAEMQHCTIQFKQCEKEHGWLTATNWVQHDCRVCQYDRLLHAAQEAARALRFTLDVCEDMNETTGRRYLFVKEALAALERVGVKP